MDDMELNPSGEQPKEVNVSQCKPVISPQGDGIDKKKLVLIISAIVIALAVLVVSLILINNKSEEYSTGLAYKVNEDGKTCTITGLGYCTDEKLFIPPSMDGYTVTGIGDNAFNCYYDLKEITIPNTVISIGDSAFYSCYKLNNITIPDSVTSIGNSAFAFCESLANITIPNSIPSIEKEIFYNCISLESIIIPNSVTSIGDSAFSRCDSLTSITIPDSVISIGDSAFSGCDSLENISIPDSVMSIGNSPFYDCNKLIYSRYDNAYYLGNDNNPYLYLADVRDNISNCTIHPDTRIVCHYAFYGYWGLKKITIPDSVISVGDSAFEDCRSLTSITIPNSVISIGDSAFSGCESLESVYIGDSVTSIGNKIFYRCSSLESVYVGDSVTSIGDSAFSRCESLESINIPDSVKSISDSAFYYCRSLYGNNYDNAYYLGNDNNPYLYLIRCTSFITSCKIHPDTKFVGYKAFNDCDYLSSVIIPISVTNIGEDAFYSCRALTIYCEAEAKPDGWHEDWNSNNNPVVWGYKD